MDCERCPRLRGHAREIARVRRRAFRDQDYWARPVPGFGDRAARILLVGLAPAAHGANRTGRIFTGDRSGDFLYAALHRAGLANQSTSIARDDGLALAGTFVTAVNRCAPPANLPTREEMDRCSEYLAGELQLLRHAGVVVALGGIAWEAMLRQSTRVDPHSVPRPRPRFGHAAEAALVLRPGAPARVLLGCYHPSQQNTQTGRLTPSMIDAVLRRARDLAGY